MSKSTGHLTCCPNSSGLRELLCVDWALAKQSFGDQCVPKRSLRNEGAIRERSNVVSRMKTTAGKDARAPHIHQIF
ncbi:MAG: hypothetical protein WCD79_20605 [Chthoniobacteraceae bacterium]